MKNVSWQDIAKLGETNPIIAKHIEEISLEGMVYTRTHAAALLAMVDALDTRCAQLEVEARRYRWLKEKARKEHGAFYDWQGSIDLAMAAAQAEADELAKKAESGGGKVANEDAGS